MAALTTRCRQASARPHSPEISVTAANALNVPKRHEVKKKDNSTSLKTYQNLNMPEVELCQILRISANDYARQRLSVAFFSQINPAAPLGALLRGHSSQKNKSAAGLHTAASGNSFHCLMDLTKKGAKRFVLARYSRILKTQSSRLDT